VFKILRRGEHEASGEADLAMRYDMTVPLARVAAAYGSQLPMPYKRYAMGPVWRADRPGKGRYRELTQCDLDTLGSSAMLADAEVLSAVHDTLAALGLTNFSIQLNSRQVLAGLLEAFRVPPGLGQSALTALDKLDKLPPAEVTAELAERGLTDSTAAELVDAVLSRDAAQQLAVTLKQTERGMAGLEEVSRILDLVGPQLPPERIGFSPSMVRGLSYYTGPIWEVTAAGGAGSLAGGGRYDHLIEQLGGPDIPATGGSLGVERILLLLPEADAASHRQFDVAVPVLDQDLASQSFGLAATARGAGLRASIYLGGSGKLGRQLKWASDAGARWVLIYGRQEQEAAAVTVRDMLTGAQSSVPLTGLGRYLSDAAADEAGRPRHGQP
jgi:histidyl-tRNA synthetase